MATNFLQRVREKFLGKVGPKVVEIIGQVSAEAKPIAAQVANEVMQAILDHGELAAKALIAQRLPAHADKADAIISQVKEVMSSAVEKATTGKTTGTIQGAYDGFRGADLMPEPHNPIGAGDDPAFAIRSGAYQHALMRSGMSARTGSCGCNTGSSQGAGSASSGTITPVISRVGSDEGEPMDLTTVSDYTNSVNAKAKDDVINRIIEVANGLGIQVSGDDRASKLKSLAANLPQKIKAGDERQAQVCAKIAHAINGIHGEKIIDTTLPTDEVCRQVLEIVTSLGVGMHTEFLSVYNSVRRVLKNLHVLKLALQEDHKALSDKILASDDQMLAKESRTLMDLHNVVVREVDRQLSLLSNLLNVTLVPSEKQLAAIIKSRKEITGLVDKIDTKVGTDKFGKVIADILRGLGATAGMADIIDRALKTVGMKIEEYTADNSLKNLRERLSAGMIGKSMTESELHDYLQAADLLAKNLYRAKDIAAKLSAGTTGAGELSGDSWGDNISAAGLGAGERSATGSFTGGKDYPATTMDKRVRDRKQLRGLLFTAFYRSINQLFDKLVETLNVLTIKVGGEVPLSDQLMNFREILQKVSLEIVRNKRIYHALMGYYNDALSKSKKDEFMGNLKMLMNFLDTIMEMEMYKSSLQYFSAVHNSIKSITDLVDKYSDEVAMKFGAEECPVPQKKTSTEATSADTVGDAQRVGAHLIQEEPTITYKTHKTVVDAIRQFDYKVRVAQINENLSHAGKELKHYSEKYDKIVAHSIADILREEKKLVDKMAAALEEEDVNTLHGQDIVGFETLEKAKEQKQAAKEYLMTQWECKKRFWETIEAIDTYMRVFTDGLVNNPADVKDIRAMLDDIEVINDWYSDGTGKTITEMFDEFPSFMQGDSLTDDKRGNPNIIYPTYEGKDHYYASIGDKMTKDGAQAAYPGNPHLVTDPLRARDARQKSRKVMTGLAILKNLLSVFLHVGAKFGNDELRKKIFMTPTQIYNNLVDYLCASAFTQGFGLGEAKDYIAADKANKIVQYVAPENLLQFVLPQNSLNHVVTAPGTYDIGVSYLGSVINKRYAHSVNQSNVINFKSRWGVWMRSVYGQIRDHELSLFKHEDQYFVLAMKSIAAKIFTVTGMYDVTDRPYEFNGLTPIRMILGGSEEAMPKIDENVVALYLRLPLLAQFYRNIFGFDEAKFEDDYTNLRMKDTHAKISMVPDIEGVFSNIIRFVFRKTKHVDNNSYSDEDIKTIIRECNAVYQHMLAKHPQDTVMKTIHEFVDEINRRYGVITQDERNRYEREYGYRYDYSKIREQGGPVLDRYDEAPDTEFAILPGEGDEEVSRPSAASRLLGADFNSAPKDNPYTITDDHRKLVYKFRCALDKYFEENQEEYSFVKMIKATQLKLKNETKDEERFKIVCQLVRGIDIYSKVDGMKYVLFHETVVGGLNMLSAMHTQLSRFKLRAQCVDIEFLQECVWDYLSEREGLKSVSGLIMFIAKKFEELGLIDSYTHPEIDNLLENLLGKYEANVDIGGHDGVDYTIKCVDGVPALPAAVPREIRTQLFGSYGNGDATMLTLNYVAGGAATRTLPRGVNYGGLMSLVAGYKVKDLRDALKSKDPKLQEMRLRAETFMHFLFSKEFIMRELIETLFGLGQDFQEMVKVHIDDGKLYINYGNLKTQIEEMFQHVHYFMDLLRPHISNDLFNRYVDKLKPGSYYWLQEQLMEKIILGRPAQLAPIQGEKLRVGYDSIDVLAQKLSGTWEFLTSEKKFNGANLQPSNPTTHSEINKVASMRSNYDKVFAQLIFYDSTLPQSGLVRSQKANKVNGERALDGAMTADFLHDPYDALLFHGSPKNRILDTRFVTRFQQLYTWKEELTGNRSAMYAFNQLIAKFIQTFYDPVNAKMYKGLLDSFANGSFSRSVADYMYTYPDVVPAWFVQIGSPEDVRVSPINRAISSVANKETYDTLLSVLKSYLSWGIESTQSSTEDRSKLLDPSNADLTKTIQIGGYNNTPRVYFHMLLHALSFIIEELLTTGVPAQPATGALPAVPAIPQPANNVAYNFNFHWHNLICVGLDVTKLQTGVTPFSTIREMYSGKSGIDPTREQILSALYKLGIDGVLRNNNSFGVGGGAIPITWPAARGPFNIGFGRSTHEKWVNMFNDVLRAPHDKHLLAAAVDNQGSIILQAMELNPTSSNPIGRSESELNFNAERFALLLTLLGEGVVANDRAKITLAKNIVTTVNKTYAPPASIPPKFDMKYDDALLASDTFLWSSSIPPPVGAANYLVAARDKPIPQTYGVDKFEALGLSGQAQGTRDLNAIQQYGRRMDPDGEHVLFTSLATILRNLVSSRAENQTLVYMLDNPADLPLYMKERMRVGLPGFRNLFRELVTKCEFLKRLMSQNEVGMERKFDCWADIAGTAPPNGGKPTHNPWPFTLLEVTTDSAASKERFTGILDSIIRGCGSFISACDQVLKEIGDDPKYLELFQNSIKDYKAQYGFDPLMPLSSTMAVLKNANHKSYLDFFPIHSLGEDSFKLSYGMRALVGNPTAQPLLESMPGWSALVESFNLLVDAKLAADKAKCEAFAKTFVRMLRYVYEFKHIKGLITPYLVTSRHAQITPNSYNPTSDVSTRPYNGGMFARDDLVGTEYSYGTSALRAGNASGKTIYDAVRYIAPTNRSDVSLLTKEAVEPKNEYPVPVYSIGKTLNDVIKMTESSFRDEKIKELVEYLSASTRPRNSLEIQNIIDLNIVPINVHALMREIPLVNLYNYAYTFDRMIIELFYGLQNDNARKLIAELCMGDSKSSDMTHIKSAKDMLVALLIDPYRNVQYGKHDTNPPSEGKDEYEEYVKPMLLGVAAPADLGRPKFLSDQIYGKAIFGETYQSRSHYNEMGPPAGHISAEKISIDVAARIMGGIIYDYVAANTATPAHKLHGVIQGGTGFTVDKLVSYIESISKYVLERPKVSTGQVIKALQKLRYKATQITANVDAFNFYMVIMTKLIEPAISIMFSQLKSTGDFMLGIGTYLNSINMLMSTLRSFNITSSKYMGIRAWNRWEAFGTKKFVSLTIEGIRKILNAAHVAYAGTAPIQNNTAAILRRILVNNIKTIVNTGNLVNDIHAVLTNIITDLGAQLDMTEYPNGLIMVATGNLPTSGDVIQFSNPSTAIGAPNYTDNDWINETRNELMLNLRATKDYDNRERSIWELTVKSLNHGKKYPEKFDPTLDSIQNDVHPTTPHRILPAVYKAFVKAAEHIIDEIQLTAQDAGTIVSTITNVTIKRNTDTWKRADEQSDAVDSGPRKQYLHWLGTHTLGQNEEPSTDRGVTVGRHADNDNVLDRDQVRQVDVSQIADVLAIVGKLRFDTVFIRNLIFITNLYRSVRAKLNRDLQYSRDIILKSAAITRPQLTEFFGNQVDQDTRGANDPYYRSGMFKRHGVTRY